MLSIEHVTKDYPAAKGSYRALTDICLTFPDVQFVAILGPSGCGKTTLLNLIGGLDSITSGDIYLNQISLKNRKAKELDSYRNNEIGFIFQDYYLIPNFSALDNVRIGLAVRGFKKKEAAAKSIETLGKIGIIDLADKKPNTLSGGQQQRVAIARALATDPKIILADEPTGALDSKNSLEIMNILKEISKSRLVIMVTHNEELASKYADRIIRLQDGVVVSDSSPVENSASAVVKDESLRRESHLPFSMTLRFALHNLVTKKMKTVLTCITSSLGMLGISFFLSLNNGFSHYANNLSQVTASSLPVVLSSYTYRQQTDTENFMSINASVEYPDVEEIYPQVGITTTTDYTYNYNNFTPKFFNYLNDLVEENLASEYVVNYGNSFSFNLVTHYPQSLNAKYEGSCGTVSTSLTSSNSAASTASLPINIFHVLYGNLDDYDVIAGSLPQNDTELVLVVNEYNSVSFRILQALGFYNLNDTEDEVRDSTLATKVKPISFADVIGKEYKVFSNDEYFTKDDSSSRTITDDLGNRRELNVYQPPADLESFYKDNGETLKISGIIRPKQGSSYNLLSPSLCFLPSLQERLVSENNSSEVSQSIKNNVYIDIPEDEDVSNMLEELESILDTYLESNTTILPTSALTEFFNKYFIYKAFNNSSYSYIGLGKQVSDAMIYGADLIPDSLKGLDLSNKDVLKDIADQLLSAFTNGDTDTIFDLLVGIYAYIDGFSLINSVVIIPTSLDTRNSILDAIDSFNEISADDSPLHASSTKEQVFYSDINRNWMVDSVGEVIDMTSTILLIFAAVSLTVSISMIALLTSKNVIEREKEIGLLRALGSRKFDIALLFEVEALAIGLFTGLLGSFLSYLLGFLINYLINSYYPEFMVGAICDFTIVHALIVVSISLVISFLAALIPSYRASKKDPAKCLKSE